MEEGQGRKLFLLRTVRYSPAMPVRDARRYARAFFTLTMGSHGLCAAQPYDRRSSDRRRCRVYLPSGPISFAKSRYNCPRDAIVRKRSLTRPGAAHHCHWNGPSNGLPLMNSRDPARGDYAIRRCQTACSRRCGMGGFPSSRFSSAPGGISPRSVRRLRVRYQCFQGICPQTSVAISRNEEPGRSGTR